MSQAQRFPLFHPFSRRLHLLVLCMFGVFNSTYMNVNLAITMTCMVNSTAVSMEKDEITGPRQNISMWTDDVDSLADTCSSNENGRKVLDYGGSLVWNHRVQNLLFSASFWGAIATVVPSIFLVQRMNKKLVFMFCVLNKKEINSTNSYGLCNMSCNEFITVSFSAVVNALLPYLAIHHGVNAVFIARFILGAGESFIYPCINTIVTNWFPIDERSTAVALFTTGNQVALFLGNPLAATLCDSTYGWPAVYYISAAMGATWCVLWMLFSSTSPDECRVMNMDERKFLKKSAGVSKEAGQTRSPPVPWKKIITNRAFIAHLISTWIITNVATVMMVYLPTYYKDVLLLGVIMNGMYSSLPMMFNFVFKLSWGVLVDRLKRRRILTPTQGVKISQCFPTFGVASGLIPVALLATCQRPVLTLALLCFTNMCLGAHTSGAYTSLLSLAPRFTPTLSSISVSISMLAQLTTPFTVAAVISTGTAQEWNNLFLLTSLLCIVSGTVFSVFGSGDVQEFAGLSKNIDSVETNNNLLSPLGAGSLRADSVSML